MNVNNQVNREMGAQYVIFDARMLSNVSEQIKKFSFRVGFLHWIKDEFWKRWEVIFWFSTIAVFVISFIYNFKKASDEFKEGLLIYDQMRGSYKFSEHG